MKIPNRIKKAICDCAEAYEVASQNDRMIRTWLQKAKLVDEDFENLDSSTDVANSYVDAVQMSNSPEEFIEYIKKLKV